MLEPDSASSMRQLRAFVEHWRTLAPLLDEIEAEEVRVVDTATSLRLLDGEVRAMLHIDPPGPSSGLVEMQRLFGRARKRL